MKSSFKVIALGAVTALFLTVMPVSAQVSNTDKSTFGRFGTDVDKFFSTGDYTLMDLNRFFAFTRLGTGLKKGQLDIGFGAKASDTLYVGAYYGGITTAETYSTGTSEHFSVPVRTSEAADYDTVDVGYYMDESVKPFGKVGALVGIKGVGIKLVYDSGDLKSDSTHVYRTSANQKLSGKSKVTAEFGGLALGPINKISLDINIVGNSVINRAFANTSDQNSSVTYSGSTVYTTGSLDPTNVTLAQLKSDGSYVAPNIYLNLDLSKGKGFGLENDLSFNIYGNPVRDDLEGKKRASGYGGNSVWSATYYGIPNASRVDTVTVVWNKKFHLTDKINPYYGNTIAATDKLSIGFQVSLPITLAFDNNKISAYSKNPVGFPLGETTAEDFNQSGSFGLGLVPTAKIAVKYQPVKIIDLHAGLQLEAFDFDVTWENSKKVDKFGDTSKEAALVNQLTGLGMTYSNKSSSSVANITAPRLGFAAGFTAALGPVGLDMVFLQVADPTLPGAVFSGVSSALGSSETSVVLTLKL
ncbi:hypothetical protein AGMMS49940_21330 [Spirochaetia bacterium]|nr:hypothetical protein AGMMS49940_21330 [Spirochaetia bacterium]